MTIEFDKNIPIPDTVVRTKYNFDLMEVGDSKFWPGSAGACGKAVAAFSRKNPSKKFTVRKMQEGDPAVVGERVWRIE